MRSAMNLVVSTVAASALLFGAAAQAQGYPTKTVTLDGQKAVVPALPAKARNGDSVALTLRPEAIVLANGAPRDIVFEGDVTDVAFLGSVIRLKVRLGENAIELDTFNDQRTPPPALNQKVQITLSGADVFVLGD